MVFWITKSSRAFYLLISTRLPLMNLKKVKTPLHEREADENLLSPKNPVSKNLLESWLSLTQATRAWSHSRASSISWQESPPTVIPPNKYWSPSKYLLATKLTSCQTSSDENFQSNKLNTASVEWALGEVLTLQPALWTTKHSLAVFTASPSFKSNNSSKMQHRCYPKPNSTSPA